VSVNDPISLIPELLHSIAHLVRGAPRLDSGMYPDPIVGLVVGEVSRPSALNCQPPLNYQVKADTSYLRLLWDWRLWLRIAHRHRERYAGEDRRQDGCSHRCTRMVRHPSADVCFNSTYARRCQSGPSPVKRGYRKLRFRVPETICDLRVTILFSVSRKVPLTTLVFGASNRLLFSIWWSGLKRRGIASLI